ncbi:MAG TPA: 5-dehydro-4-deoxy-D-glucuronate isomerase [Bacteroidota bacterium]|nr:5-dehydro-4-deoxy-D-glucuronate isomerase [Bacteroidota bacterium]
MEMRTLPDDVSYARMTTEELRRAFLIERLFREGTLTLVGASADRAVVGGCVPLAEEIPLTAPSAVIAADSFLERREIGITNIGGEGSVVVGSAHYPLRRGDVLYLGRGVHDVRFASADRRSPSAMYFVSFPAHAQHPPALVRREEAEAAPLGTASGANRRTIRRYIHAGGAGSCQLVMGITELEEGSVWNTMPPHTHMRRTEVYLYFGLEADQMALHLMGKPHETRSIIVRDREAVISPPWSIHAGAGTHSYAFVWAMGGENQEFADMDASPVGELR